MIDMLHAAQHAADNAAQLVGSLGFLAGLLVAGILVYVLGRRMILKVRAPGYVRRPEAMRRVKATRLVVLHGWRLVVVSGIGLAMLTRLDRGVIPSAALATALAFTIGFGIMVPLLKDVFPGTQMLLEAQFIVGDRVKLQGVDDAVGVVESTGLRITVIRRDDGSRMFVPNGTITAVENYSVADTWDQTTELTRVSAELHELAGADQTREMPPIRKSRKAASGTATRSRRPEARS